MFIVAGWPMLGYAVAAAAWLAQWAIELTANRRVARALADRERRTALGVLGASTLARVWLVALAILLVGLLGERQDGLAAALLSAVLFTVIWAAEAWSACWRRARGGDEDPDQDPARARRLPGR